MSGTALTIELEPDEVVALDRYVATAMPGRSREEALAEIVAQWLAARPVVGEAPVDEGLKPQDLNASNDS